MKAVLVIDEMPNSCDECEVRCGGYTAKEYSEKGMKRPSWCPLKPLPKEKEDLYFPYSEYERALNEGWNACLEALEDPQNWEDSNE